ncbi:YciI family protein [Blastococcus sp. SYSU D01042]
MAKYAILIYEDPAFYATMSPEAWAAVFDAHSTFSKQVVELGGSIAAGAALAPTTTATTIKGGGTVTDGPFVETKEAFGGFYVVEARDLDHAVEIAGLCPAPGGGVEVRPVVDATTNPF